MRNSDQPPLLLTAFASSADGDHVRNLPVTTGDPNAASWALGFPPNTFTDEAAGGSPPNGKDMNGVLRLMSQWIKWNCLGGTVSFQQAVADAGGYPSGARLTSANDPSVTWCSIVDNNTSNPDAGGSGWIKGGMTSSNTNQTQGHIQLNDFIVNFGHVTTYGNIYVEFDKPFSVACLLPWAINDCGSNRPQYYAGVGAVSNTGMNIGSSSRHMAGVFWGAIGI